MRTPSPAGIFNPIVINTERLSSVLLTPPRAETPPTVINYKYRGGVYPVPIEEDKGSNWFYETEGEAN